MKLLEILIRLELLRFNHAFMQHSRACNCADTLAALRIELEFLV